MVQHCASKHTDGVVIRMVTAVKGGVQFACIAVFCAVIAACGGDTSSGSNEGTVSENNVENPDAKIGASSMAVSPDGSRVVAQGSGGLCVWDTSDGTITDRFSGGSTAAWSPDGSLIATDDTDANVVLIDADTGKQHETLSGHDVPDVEDGSPGLTDIAFSPDGDLMASAGEDNSVRVWSLADGESQAVLDTGDDYATHVEFSPDGSHLVVAGAQDPFSNGDTPVQIWDVDSGERVSGNEIQGHNAIYGPDGKRLAVVDLESDDEEVYLADIDSPDTHKTYPRRADANDMGFSPDGSLLAIADNQEKDVVVWPIKGGKPVTLSGHNDAPKAVQFSPDGRFLYSASNEGGIVKWRVNDGNRAEQFELP